MSTFLALAGITVACHILMRIFKPRYGAMRCCTGRALESAMEEETKKRADETPGRKTACMGGESE